MRAPFYALGVTHLRRPQYMSPPPVCRRAAFLPRRGARRALEAASATAREGRRPLRLANAAFLWRWSRPRHLRGGRGVAPREEHRGGQLAVVRPELRHAVDAQQLVYY